MEPLSIPETSQGAEAPEDDVELLLSPESAGGDLDALVYSTGDNGDDDVVFFESPPASPTFFASAIHADLGLGGGSGSVAEAAREEADDAMQFILDVDAAFDSSVLALKPSFRRRVLEATERNSIKRLPSLAHALAGVPNATASSLGSREAYQTTLALLRSEIANAKAPEYQIPSREAKPNTSFMVLTSTHVANPSFDMPVPGGFAPGPLVADTLSIQPLEIQPPDVNAASKSNSGLKIPSFGVLRRLSSPPVSPNVGGADRMPQPDSDAKPLGSLSPSQTQYNPTTVNGFQMLTTLNLGGGGLSPTLVPAGMGLGLTGAPPNLPPTPAELGFKGNPMGPLNAPQSAALDVPKSGFGLLKPLSKITTSATVVKAPPPKSKSNFGVLKSSNSVFAPMGPGGPSQGVLPRPVILSRDGMVTDAVQQQSLPPISSGTHAPASSFRSQSPSPSPQPGNIVPIPPRTSSLRPTSPLPRPAQPMVNPAPLTTSHSEPTLTLSTTPIQIPSVQTQPPSPVTSGSSPSTSYNSTANPDGATVPNGRVRKPPPAPKSNAPKSLNLESKFQLAKLCIEGSVLYGASDVEIQALKDEGYAHLTDLSSQGMADANYYLGKCFAEDGNYAMAFPAFLRAAKAQLPEASFAAASCLEVGKGTPVSYLTARYYYTASAEAGYLLAMHRMAAGLLNGEIGFERDVYGGIKWLEKCAAYQRYFDAALDPVKSLSLYQLSQLYEYGIPGVMQPSIILALKFLQEAAAESYPAALTRLAAAYESGSMNLPCDIEKASKLYTKAAELQDLEALFVMADLSLRGLTIIDCDCALADLEIPASLTQYLLPDPPEESLCETWDLPGFSSPPTETPTSSPQQPVPNLFPPKHSGPCSYKTLIPQDALLAFQYLNQITSHPSCPGKLHADAQYALGYLYEHPLLEPTVHQDSMKAIALYEAAALGGSLLARHRVAQMRAASALNEGMLMEDAGLESVNSRSGVGGIFGKAGEEDAARDAFRKAMEGAGGTFGVAGGEDRRFGIVKARRVRKKATEEFEKKLEVAGMLSAPVLDLKAMSDAKERRSTAWQSGGQPQGDEKCLLM